MRELAPDGTPWLDLQPFQADELATIAEQAGPGDVVRVRVRRRSNNGYQVELLPGADAFVPLQHCPPEIEAERDDVLAARIVRLDVADRRIVVSLADAPASAEGARPLRLVRRRSGLPRERRRRRRARGQRARSQRGELTDVRAPPRGRRSPRPTPLRAERDRLAEELRDERLRARALAADLRSTAEGGTDLDALLRAEALRDPDAFLAWLGVAHAKLHDPPERARYPLRRVVVGPHFLDSLRELQGVSLHRVLDACVHVATGRRHRDPGTRAAPAARGRRRHRAAPAAPMARAPGAARCRCTRPRRAACTSGGSRATASSSTASAPTTQTSRAAC